MVFAVIVSLLTGVTVVTSRTINAKLAQETNVLASTFYNYVAGLTLSLLCFFLLGRNEVMPEPFLSGNAWIYLGGFIGVLVVLISNVTVTKISSFHMTVLMFLGQVYGGIVLDTILSGTFSLGNFLGGTFVAIGLFVNLKIDQKDAALYSNTKKNILS